MCALGYYLEREGIMTTGISLVRENAESMQPPRTLWVPFSLGRPLGVPGDPEFQHRVIAAALALLNRDSGPMLADYLESAPAAEPDAAPACPVSFTVAPEAENWPTRLLAELAMLQPWYELGRRRRKGRSLVGVSGLSVRENFLTMGEYLEQEMLPINALEWFKAAIEDAKAFYLEALTAQPGNYDQNRLYAMLWHETVLGAALGTFYERFQAHPKLHGFARILLPREAVGGSTGDEMESSSNPETPS